MQWRDIPFHPATRTLRVFAFGLAALLAGLACWRFVAGSAGLVAIGASVAALALGVAGLAFPTLLRPLFVGWMILVFPINWLVAHLLLAFVFYVMLTPLGLLFRLTGRDLLGLRLRPDLETYWTTKPSREELKSYFRPF